DACRFRHALVREALYDDLLPGERERLHVAAAEALTTSERLDEHVRWALLAHHWDAAGLPVKAYAASLNAADEAQKLHAYADAAAQYERALRLYDQLPDPGIAKFELLMRTATANDASHGGQRSIDLARAALREMELPGQDVSPEQRALVLERIGRYNWGKHDAAAAAAYEQAVTLLEGRPTSREQAFTRSALGQSLMLRNRYRESEQVLQQAIAIARAVGAGDVEAHALCSLGPVLVGTGRTDEGLATMRQAEQLAIRVGSDEEQCRVYTNLTHCLYLSARYDEAAQAAAEGIEVSIRNGYQRAYGQSVLGNWLMAMYCAGRWDDAVAVRADPRIRPGDPYQELRWLPLLLARGRDDEARPLIKQVLAETIHADDMQFRGQALLRAAELAARDGQWDEARANVAEVLTLAESGEDQYYRAQTYGLALRIEADRPAPSPTDVADRVASAAAAWGAALPAQLPEVRAWLADAAASHSQVHGRDTAESWSEVAAIWDEVGQPFRAAQARYRQADALLRARSRDEATALLREVLRAATSLGAAPLVTQVRQLAQRARVELAGALDAAAAPDPVAALNLTPRELDVLTLLAQGRTNRQIGEALFISEKTASVHVTNLLRKLGVPNRIEAAAIGQRVGL
ncbi:MAG TPA: LuxR C-terminal-related transcriptional regulator, partial [Jatrophihabitantaceae bacterium]